MLGYKGPISQNVTKKKFLPQGLSIYIEPSFGNIDS